MRAITTASLLLACCVFFCSQTYAQQSSKEVGSQTGTRALVNGVRAWLVTKDGSVPVEETGVRYLTRNVDYSCTRKPLFEVVRDLKELAPVTVNRQALKFSGLTLNVRVSIPDSKRLVDVFRNLNRQLDLGIVVGTKSIEVTTMDDCDSRELTQQYDVTELVAFEGKPVSSEWIDTDGLQQVITSTVVPDTWEVGNFKFPIKIEKKRVLMSVPQDSLAHFEINAFLDALFKAAEGKRRSLEFKRTRVKAAKGKDLQSWLVDDKSTGKFNGKTVLYDVSGRFADRNAVGEFVVEQFLDVAPYGRSDLGYATAYVGEKHLLIIWGSEKIHDAVKRMDFPSLNE